MHQRLLKKSVLQLPCVNKFQLVVLGCRFVKPATLMSNDTVNYIELFSMLQTSNSKHAEGSSAAKTDVHQPPTTDFDMIGPANQVSNLRPIKFYIPSNESPIEREFRLEREKVQNWNEEFWIKHNKAFVKEAEDFRRKKLEGCDGKKSLNAEEMSEFYKAFLDKNWKRHVSYNFEWYAKNFSLAFLSFQVKLSKIKNFCKYF